MEKDELKFDELMQLYNYISEEERHFNSLELEYRKLASQWLLVSLGAVGFVITKQEIVPVNIWVLVIGICFAASIGIMVLWLLDLKVYHELLNSVFSEGLELEKKHQHYFPQIRKNMVESQQGGNTTKRVILFYFFSVLLLFFVANISIWMMELESPTIPVLFNNLSIISIIFIYKLMDKDSKAIRKSLKSKAEK
jgi:hypothetical protein